MYRWVCGGWLKAFCGRGASLAFTAPLVLACLFGTAARAHAQSVAVLGLASEEGDDELANGLTRAVRSEVEGHDGYQVNASHVSLAQMTMAQDCEITDAQCRIAVAKALQSDRI